MKKKLLQDIIFIIFSILIYIYLYNEINKKNFNIIFIFYVLVLLLYNFFNIYSYIISFIIILFLNNKNNEYFTTSFEGGDDKSIDELGETDFDEIEKDINDQKPETPEEGSQPESPNDNCDASVGIKIGENLSNDKKSANNTNNQKNAEARGREMAYGMAETLNMLDELIPPKAYTIYDY